MKKNAYSWEPVKGWQGPYADTEDRGYFENQEAAQSEVLEKLRKEDSAAEKTWPELAPSPIAFRFFPTQKVRFFAFSLFQRELVVNPKKVGRLGGNCYPSSSF